MNLRFSRQIWRIERTDHERCPEGLSNIQKFASGVGRSMAVI
jgi:hypothetical protein